MDLPLRRRLPEPRPQPLVSSFPFVDTAAMNARPAEIARTVAPGAHAILVLDGAGWHSSKTLAVPDNIPLLPLPPCSPELTPARVDSGPS